MTLHPAGLLADAHSMALSWRAPLVFQYSEVRVMSAEALRASCHLNHAATSRFGVGIHIPLRMTPGMKRFWALSSARASLAAWSTAGEPAMGAVETVSEKVTKSTVPMPQMRPAPNERLWSGA